MISRRHFFSTLRRRSGLTGPQRANMHARLHAVLSENPGGREQRLTAKAYRARRFGREFRHSTTRVSGNNKGENVAQCLRDQSPQANARWSTELRIFTSSFNTAATTRSKLKKAFRELGLTATQSGPQAACAAAALSPSPPKQTRGGEASNVFVVAITAAESPADPTKFLD